MQLIGDIIELLSDQTSSLQGALLKAQVLAHKLANQELGTWVEYELRGYPEDAPVPAYRVAHLSLFGHVTNGVYHYQNQTLATGHLEDRLKKRLTEREVRESVTALEGWRDADKLAITIPAEACHFLSEPLSETYFVQQAWGRFGVGAIDQMLVQVRSRLLEFCLRIAEDFPAGLTGNEIKEKAEQMGQNDIFRHAVFGDNATIVVGTGNISHISNRVEKGDFGALAEYLARNGVSAPDVEELRVAIADDGEPPPGGGLGSRVRQWMSGMLAKAGTSAWQVSIGAAGNVLGVALGQYYGLGT